MNCLRLLVEDVERPVEVVHEEAAAARLVAQEIHARQLAARVLAAGIAGDRHLDVVGQLQCLPRRGRLRAAAGAAATCLVRRERAQVVDDAPDLGVREPAVPPRHHRRRHALLDDGVDLAVGRTVVPLVVGQIGRLFSALLLDDRDDDAGFLGALGPVAVAAGAVGVVGALAGGERLWAAATGFFSAAEGFRFSWVKPAPPTARTNASNGRVGFLIMFHVSTSVTPPSTRG